MTASTMNDQTTIMKGMNKMIETIFFLNFLRLTINCLLNVQCMGPIAKGNQTYTEEYLLKRALENLEKIDAVGITNELDNLIVQVRN